jgi:4-hydroxybenzoate polyprenyltransferase
MGYGLLVLVFSLAMLTSTARLGDMTLPGLTVLLAATVSAFLFFVQLRVGDEFKDAPGDYCHRPHLPVPRGLVSLRELGWLALGGAIVQAALALWLAPSMLLLLLLVWGYLLLMRYEFGIGEWLTPRPLAYLITHMPSMALIAGYVSAWIWLPAGAAPPAGLVWLLLLGIGGGLVIEFGRKLRAPADDEPGTTIYTVCWGPLGGVGAWLGTMLLMLVSVRVGMAPLAGSAVLLVIPGVVWLGALLVSWRFVWQQQHRLAAWFQPLSALWLLVLYSVVSMWPQLSMLWLLLLYGLQPLLLEL